MEAYTYMYILLVGNEKLVYNGCMEVGGCEGGSAVGSIAAMSFSQCTDCLRYVILVLLIAILGSI